MDTNHSHLSYCLSHDSEYALVHLHIPTLPAVYIVLSHYCISSLIIHLSISFTLHTPHTSTHALLSQVPQLVDSLSGLYQLLDARVGTFSRLSRLQGKLDLMLTQAATAKDTEQDHAHLTTPLLTVTVGGVSDYCLNDFD